MEIRVRTSSEDGPLITAHEQAARILRSSAWSPEVGGEDRLRYDTPILLMLGPEEHDLHRRLVEPVFLPRAISRWTHSVTQIVTTVLSGDWDEQEIPAGEISRDICARAACSFVGLPDTMSSRIRQLVEPLFDLKAGSDVANTNDLVRLHHLVARVPKTDSLLPKIEELPPDDLLAARIGMLTAGTELTARGLMACLVDGAAGGLKSEVDIDSAVSNSKVIGSVARTHCPSDGHESWDQVLVSLSLTRRNGSNRNIPFGFGRHYCLGANWARLVIGIGIKEFWNRFPTAQIGSITYSDPSVVVGGVTDVVVRA